MSSRGPASSTNGMSDGIDFGTTNALPYEKAIIGGVVRGVMTKLTTNGCSVTTATTHRYVRPNPL
jgi:hypothetical protein